MRRSERKAIDPDIGMLAARLLFTVHRELKAGLAADADCPTNPRHGAVLAYLDEEGSRATDLATQSGQHKQVIGTLVDELVEFGYVERQPDPQDRRAKLIVPTASGREHIARADAIVAALEQDLAAKVGTQDYADLKRILRTLTEPS